jgi:hypothetical protein
MAALFVSMSSYYLYHGYKTDMMVQDYLILSIEKTRISEEKATLQTFRELQRKDEVNECDIYRVQANKNYSKCIEKIDTKWFSLKILKNNIKQREELTRKYMERIDCLILKSYFSKDVCEQL